MVNRLRVGEFKEFVRRHPKLVEEVRNKKRSWQEIYEEWDLFGDDHEIWEPYLPDVKKRPSTANGANPAAGQQAPGLLSMLGKIDLDDVQKYAAQLNDTLAYVQQLLEKFQKDDDQSSQNPPGSYGPPGSNGFFGPPGYGPRPPHQNGPYN